jgi:Uma2 family endonuclease
LVIVFSAKRHHRYTYADYVGLEVASPTKHEFLDGEIFAMAGGSEEHSALAAEVLGAFRDAVRHGPCRVHTSDLRIYVESSGLATFPDGAVIFGALEQHGPSPKATALNPTVLLEVTSDSSEEYDTGEKLEHYRTIPSLLDYVVVSHRERRITVHSRSVTGEWMTRVAISGGSVSVSALKTELSVDEIYGKSSIL